MHFSAPRGKCVPKTGDCLWKDAFKVKIVFKWLKGLRQSRRLAFVVRGGFSGQIMATAPSLVNTMLASKSMKQKSDDEVHRQGGGQLSVLPAGELDAELSEKVQPDQKECQTHLPF